MKIIIVGIPQITEQASKSPHRVTSLKLPFSAARPTGKVLIESEFVIISGHIKLFQLLTNVKIDRAAIVGRDNGKAILQNVVNMLQPSMRDDSSISFGKFRKN